ncbi:restriction endonuclease subunit S, partial [Mucilaginibacter phyllosphaerae]|uniref:restriction endonuclease subunit S n=1 Tax=Mucilaginibacter phyllosphaerae TaxID=1812349 RepID=UPI00166CD7F8
KEYLKTGSSFLKVPNLRFPGFTEKWEEIKLVDITEKINSGKTPLGGESVYLSEGIVFIRSQNVNNEKLELENPVYISEEVNATMKNSVVKPNDILLNITGASLGRSCVVPDDFALGNVNQHVCIIRLKENYNPRFLQPIFSSAKGQSIFESLQTGSGREGLNFDSIKKIILKMPVAGEQLKIASFLSLLNKRIETQNKIIEELQTLMQILTKEIFS